MVCGSLEEMPEKSWVASLQSGLAALVAFSGVLMVICGCVVLAMSNSMESKACTTKCTTVCATPTATTAATTAATTTAAAGGAAPTTTTTTTTTATEAGNTTLSTSAVQGSLGEHVAMIVAECTMDKPWALLVWGVITIILYSFIAIAGMDRAKAIDEDRGPNALIQCLQHIGNTDGASAWWFSMVLIGAYEDTEDCRERPDTIGLVLTVITLTLRVQYGIVQLFTVIHFCCKRK